jgi:predicted amidohydrolase
MKVSSLQITVTENDKDATLRKAEQLIRSERDADLIILPELWNIGFLSFDRYVSEAEDENGPTLTCLKQLAAELSVHIHTGSFVESDNGQYYNTSYLLSPQGSILGKYRKIHLFGYQSQETQILRPGKEVTVVETPLGKIGMATCYDLRFPELFRRMTDMGAELFLVCSAWPYPRLEAWIMLNRVRALENQAFLVSANSVGPNRGGTFVGHSMAVDPWGTIMRSGGDEEVVLRAEFDMASVDAIRKRFPPLADRTDWL